MAKVLDLTAHKYGRWTVLSRSENTSRGFAQWLCQCECGTTKVVRASNLRGGISRSCGCLHNEMVSERNKVVMRTHGASGTRAHDIWRGMLSRCRNPSATGFEHYGGRGISVCERWESFENFLSDMWPPPSDRHSLERKENDGNYEPGNVEWALPDVQLANRRNTIWLRRGDVEKPLMHWARELGINRATLYTRHQKGLQGEELFRKVAH